MQCGFFLITISQLRNWDTARLSNFSKAAYLGSGGTRSLVLQQSGCRVCTFNHYTDYLYPSQSSFWENSIYCIGISELQALLNLLCTTQVVIVTWPPTSCPDLQDKVGSPVPPWLGGKGHSLSNFLCVRSIFEQLYELNWEWKEKVLRWCGLGVMETCQC